MLYILVFSQHVDTLHVRGKYTVYHSTQLADQIFPPTLWLNSKVQLPTSELIRTQHKYTHIITCKITWWITFCVYKCMQKSYSCTQLINDTPNKCDGRSLWFSLSFSYSSKCSVGTYILPMGGRSHPGRDHPLQEEADHWATCNPIIISLTM